MATKRKAKATRKAKALGGTDAYLDRVERFQKAPAEVSILKPKHLLTATVMVTLAEFPDGEFECFLSPLEVSGHYKGAGAIKRRSVSAYGAAERAISELLTQAGLL